MLQSIRDFFFPRPVDFTGRKRARVAAAAATGAVEAAPIAAAPAADAAK